MSYLQAVTFIRDFRTFKQGDSFEFSPGVNLLVGDQGCGKSTLIHELRVHSGCDPTLVSTTANSELRLSHPENPPEVSLLDFEKDNPRVSPRLVETMDTGFQLESRFISHGETTLAFLNLLSRIDHPRVIIIDEPDTALSPKSCYRLASLLRKAASVGCQVIASVHNPIVIESWDRIYSLEHREFMSGKDFLNRHLSAFCKEL